MFQLSFGQGKRRLFLGLILMLLILISSCNLRETFLGQSKLSPNRCNKVAILLPDSKSSPRYEATDRPELERQISKRLLKHLKDNEDLTLLYFNAEGFEEDPNKQVQQAQLALNQDVCLLIVDPANEKSYEIVKKVKGRNIPVIAYDRYIKDDKGENYANYYVSFNTILVGQKQALYIFDELKKGEKSKYKFKPKNNKYIMINGSDDDLNTRLLEEGFREVLEEYIRLGIMKPVQLSNLKISEQLASKIIIDPKNNDQIYIKGWKEATAEEIIIQILNENRDLKIIWVGNDTMAQAIINKLTDDQKGNILITGQDGNKENLKYIDKGWQAITVCKNSKDLAETTAILVESLFEGKEPNLEEGTFRGFKGKIYISQAIQPVTSEEIVKISSTKTDKTKEGEIDIKKTCQF